MRRINENIFLIAQILALTILLVFVLFMWQGNKDFSLWDEGFLWYGTQRVMLGEVPIRDFMSYDPGRYYWSAALMTLWGDNGILALRSTLAIFQAIGLFVGLLLIARTLKKQNFIYLLLSAITLIVWMYPHYKMFDLSCSILLVGILTFLIQHPTKQRYFFTGMCIGLIAVCGRNHGIYAILGSLGVMFWLSINRTEGPGFIKGFLLWGSGVVVGYMPILLMALLVPDFATAFWKSILFLLEVKATNLPRPIPWPWLVNFNFVSFGVAIRGVLIGLFFIAIIVFGILSMGWILWKKFQNQKVPSALVAASFLALPYAHYAYSRADLGHLALGIFPFLVGCLVLLAMQNAKLKWPLLFILCAASFWVLHVDHSGWQCYRYKQCVNVEISGTNLQVDPIIASDIELLRNLSNQYTSNGQTFIATPIWPGAYALLERKSPLWENYALFPRIQSFEQSEIERIKTAKPGFVLVLDFPLDGREELRFKNTHPLIHQYIVDNFELLPNLPNPAYHLYKEKGAG